MTAPDEPLYLPGRVRVGDPGDGEEGSEENQ